MGRWRTGIASVSKSFCNVFARRVRSSRSMRRSSRVGRAASSFARRASAARSLGSRATRAYSSSLAAAALGPLRANHGRSGGGGPPRPRCAWRSSTPKSAPTSSSLFSNSSWASRLAACAAQSFSSRITVTSTGVSPTHDQTSSRGTGSPWR